VFCHGQLPKSDVVVVLINLGFYQGYTNPRHQTAQVTKFCMVVPIICGYSVWSFLYITLLKPRILRWFQGLWEICRLLGLVEWPICVCLQCILHVAGDGMLRPCLMVKFFIWR
jgi:hypothetical protein